MSFIILQQIYDNVLQIYLLPKGFLFLIICYFMALYCDIMAPVLQY